MPQEVIFYNRLTKEELETNLGRLIEAGNWIDLLQNTSTVHRETIHEASDGVGFTSWIVVYHKIAEAEPVVKSCSDTELCMETSPIGLKCMLSKGHRGDHSAPIGAQSCVYWPSPVESAVAQKPSERMKALREAAGAVCELCAQGWMLRKKIYYDGTFIYIHLGAGDVWWTQCDAGAIQELIEKEIAAAAAKESG